MTEEERQALDNQKAEQSALVEADINAMDEGLLNKRVDIFTGEDSPEEDTKIVEAGPEDLEDELKEAFKEKEQEPVKAKVDEEEDDKYDFSFINELARQALDKKIEPQPTQSGQSVAAQVPVPEPVKVPEPITPSTMPFVTVEEMTEAFDSPAKMVGLLQKVYAQARNDAVQQSLMALPNAIRPVVAREAAFVEMVNNFYKENPELNDYRDFVRYCAVQIETEHPEWTPKQIMETTAKVAKKRLPSLQEAMHREARQVKPSFVDQKGPQLKPSAKKLSRLERELAEMPDY